MTKADKPDSVTSLITVTQMPSSTGSRSGSSPYKYQKYTKTWKQWCPHASCHAVGQMKDNPKGTHEGEITCGACGADYDGVTGKEKINGSTLFLYDANNKCNTVGNLSASVGEGTTASTSDSSSETETKTITEGYDIDKPFQAYVKLQYSHEPGATAERKTIYIDWSADAPDSVISFTNVKPAFINNKERSNSINIVDRLSEIEGDVDHKNKYYLRQIRLEYVTSSTEELYTSDGTDNSSCKCILRETGFRTGEENNPVSLGFSGKTILSNIQTCLDSLNYIMEVKYAQYREQDLLNFKLATDSSKLNPKYTFAEGNIQTMSVDGKIKDLENLVPIIGVSDVTFSPLSNLINDSVMIFKEKDNPNLDVSTYNYVQHRNRESVMRYGDFEDVTTMSTDVSPTEAYYEARKNTKFNDKVEATYTLQLEGVPDIEIGDYCNCVFYNNLLNDVKQIDSIEIDYDITKMPRVSTTLGMGAMDRIIAGRINMQNARRKAKEEKISFSGGLSYKQAGENLWED